MKPTRMLAVLCSIFLCVIYAGGAGSETGKTEKYTLEHGGRARAYLLHAPGGVDPDTPAALVVVLHGGGGNGKHAMKSTRFNELADEKKFLVVYPNGTGLNRNALLTWNAGGCCKYAMDNNVDDAGFMRALVADVSAKYSVDPARVYVAGFSNGAMMAYRLACEASDLFAAAAPVAGILYVDTCEPSRPIPLIIFHGTKDENVPYNGGVGRKAFIRDKRPPILESVNLFADMFHCAPVEHKEINDSVRLDARESCDGGAEILLYTIEGGGHAWPGGARVIKLEDAPTDKIDATRLIWEFFEKHPMNDAE